jgi:hypothetical protein
VIAIERRDKPQERRDRVRFAAFDCDVDRPQRFVEPGDLHVDITAGRVEAAAIDRAVNLASHRRNADFRRLGDIPRGMAGSEQVEEGLAPRRLRRPPRLRRGALRFAVGDGRGIIGHEKPPSPLTASVRGS